MRFVNILSPSPSSHHHAAYLDTCIIPPGTSPHPNATMEAEHHAYEIPVVVPIQVARWTQPEAGGVEDGRLGLGRAAHEGPAGAKSTADVAHLDNLHPLAAAVVVLVDDVPAHSRLKCFSSTVRKGADILLGIPEFVSGFSEKGRRSGLQLESLVLLDC